MSKRYWFTLINENDNFFISTNYARIQTNGALPAGSCPNPGSKKCAVYALTGNIFPVAGQFAMGENLYDYLVNAHASPYIPQPGAGKIFVYTSV